MVNEYPYRRLRIGTTNAEAVVEVEPSLIVVVVVAGRSSIVVVVEEDVVTGGEDTSIVTESEASSP